MSALTVNVRLVMHRQGRRHIITFMLTCSSDTRLEEGARLLLSPRGYPHLEIMPTEINRTGGDTSIIAASRMASPTVVLEKLTKLPNVANVKSHSEPTMR